MTGFEPPSTVNKTLKGDVDMRAMTKFFTAAAAAVALSAVAAPAGAVAIPIAGSFATGDSSDIADTVNYVDTGVGSGTLTITDALSFFDFNNSIYAGLPSLAYLTFNATTVGGSLIYDAGTTTFTQTGLSGTFDYWTGVGGTGTNLLHGVFTNMWLKGKVGDDSGGFNSVQIGGTTSLSSGLVDISWIGNDNASFTFSGISKPESGFVLTNGNTELSSFTAGGIGGTFAGATVPEPGTWALMIIGFGAAGGMLRSRRRAALAA